MRTVFGYFLIVLLFPIAVFLFYFANEEAQKVKSFDEVVEEKISIEEVKLPQASKIVDKNGDPYLEIHQPFRVIADGKTIPPFLKELFLQSEDQHFYEHAGIDAAAVMRAIWVNAKSDEIEQGASTITQQLARNVYLSHDRTFVRKVSEVLYAYELEKKLSKDEILNLYLNAIYFNNQVYGVEAAAQFYFQKHVNELTKAEMALIATIPNNPTRYDPIRNMERTKNRQERLIDIMVREEFLTASEAEDIKKEPINLKVRDRLDKYTDYSTYVEAELEELISTSEGFNEQLASTEDKESRKAIYQKRNERIEELKDSGIIVHTALDPNLQEKARKAVNSTLSYSSVEGAAAVIKNDTRDLVALVGGKDFNKTEFNRAFQAYRQPGSTIKPLLDYAPYIEKYGAGPSSIVSADKYCIGSYCPKNYSGEEYGNVSLQTALSKSYNTAAIRLFMKTGIEDAFNYMKPFQFSKVTQQDHNPSASIGGFTHGMTPLEMTGAYTSFIDGTYLPPRAIQKVTDLKGNVLYEWKDQPVQVWTNNTTNKMRILLTDVVRNGTGKKANVGKAYTGGKTGTTNNTRDLWFAGLTDQYTSAVWVGKDKPQSIRYLESYAPQQIIWRRIMQ
ncbi:penicillin-binding protein 1A [Bacillus ectoiniformans]|uniref:transglycosylase domain-containing protein n=1 Tax=Bacillus ectoiniformans TaxID=1494429 RepID=UPI0019596B7B|nr:transglycosylase domain-containing protein [Bacillus ectoiniformans]MBM7648506.1 penicillin-binding protein 1A [Bacillus ectoiniformans]